MDIIPHRPRFRRPNMRGVVVVMPSAFTLGNLFFGFWAIVSASQGNFLWAGWFVMFAGVLDMLDGRLARKVNAGTRFGAELDSLVDVISFGVAPAVIMYFLEFSTAGRFAWVICFIYVVAVAVRLARYNILSHGKPHSSWFTGLPSPSAGMTLATYFAFSQTPWYQASLAYLNLQKQGLVILILLLSALMVSNVRYPKFPGIGFRSPKAILGTLFNIALLIGAITVPQYVFFPLGMTYMVYGLLRATVLALQEKNEPADEPTDEHVIVPAPEEDFPNRRRVGERRKEL
ncbi:MAG TPA: CDP-diacylglycerol--serine O-phosphatidyltransferase [Gemmatimonadales bacterium]|nr:CDP-diacylglycerol--serine O-phosphatidyltransferase [Gemmatimonadales bacterium]